MLKKAYEAKQGSGIGFKRRNRNKQPNKHPHPPKKTQPTPKQQTKHTKIKCSVRKSDSQGSSSEIAEKDTEVTSSRPHSLAPGWCPSPCDCCTDLLNCPPWQHSLTYKTVKLCNLLNCIYPLYLWLTCFGIYVHLVSALSFWF